MPDCRCVQVEATYRIRTLTLIWQSLLSDPENLKDLVASRSVVESHIVTASALGFRRRTPPCLPPHRNSLPLSEPSRTTIHRRGSALKYIIHRADQRRQRFFPREKQHRLPRPTVHRLRRPASDRPRPQHCHRCCRICCRNLQRRRRSRLRDAGACYCAISRCARCPQRCLYAILSYPARTQAICNVASVGLVDQALGGLRKALLASYC